MTFAEVTLKCPHGAEVPKCRSEAKMGSLLIRIYLHK